MLTRDDKIRHNAGDAKLKAHTLDVLRGSAFTAISKVSITVIGFLFNLVIARSLGVAETGIFYLSLAIITIASVLSRLGLDQAVLKYASRQAAANNLAAVKAVYLRAITIVALSSAGLVVALLFIGPWISEEIFNKPNLAAPLRYMTIGIFPLSILIIHTQFLKSIKYVGTGLFLQNASVSAICLFFIVVAINVTNSEMLAGFYLAATFTACGLIIILWASVSKLRSIKADKDYSTKHLIRSSMYLYGISIVNQILLPWTAVICLGIWATESEVGQFAVARRVAMLVNFAYLAIESITGPKFSILFDRDDLVSVQHVAKRATGLMITVTAPLGFIFLFAPSWVMGWFGADFRVAAGVLTILAAGQLINVLTGSVANLLIMSGNEKAFKNISVATGISNILFCVLLVPVYGAMGAAVASALSVAVLNIMASYLVWTRLGFLPFPGIPDRARN